jgi:nicotinamide-nucleotide amidase
MSEFDQSQLETLALSVGERLVQRGWSLVTAESCTGGWIAQTATAISGSSAWFDRGFVTYSNRAKMEVLGVAEATLVQHGAVSVEIAEEMVRGALVAAQVDIAVAVTGIAGPDGGTPDKPVGTVCLGWCTEKSKPLSRIIRFDGDRHSIRAQTVSVALDGLLALIDDTSV